MESPRPAAPQAAPQAVPAASEGRAARAEAAQASVVPQHAADNRGLRRFSVVVVIATLVLIKAGAMVTSTGSGLAYLDWPLANGSWWPPDMKLDGLFEHGHRALGTVIGLLVLILTVWVGMVEQRRWLRRVTIVGLALVCVQGVIGGVGVLLGLREETSIAHGVLAQVILCLLALIAFALSPAWQRRTLADEGQVATARRFAIVSVVLVFAQLLAGAILRHGNYQGMLWLHVFNALFVSLSIACTAMYCGTRFGDAGFRGTTRAVLWLLMLQLVLGFVALGVRRVKDPSNIEYIGRSLLVTAHVLVGAMLFLTAALLLYKTQRNLQPAAGPAA